MQNRIVLLLALLMTCAAAALAQQAAPPKENPTMSGVLDRQLSGVEREFVPAAEAMPEDKYGFAPSNGEFKGVRTFALQVRHVAAANYLFAAGILEEKPPVDVGGDNGPEALKSKAEIIKFLKDSFAYAHKAVATITPQNATQLVPSPFDPKRQTTRLALAVYFEGHSFDHYGQMVEYLRMNGIIPPASRQ